MALLTKKMWVTYTTPFGKLPLRSGTDVWTKVVQRSIQVHLCTVKAIYPFLRYQVLRPRALRFNVYRVSKDSNDIADWLSVCGADILVNDAVPVSHGRKVF